MTQADPVDPVENLPREGGAYAIVMRLTGWTELPVPKPGARLGPGLYAYFGAAYGPGGPRARVRRHVLGAAKAHWHLDHLCPATTVLAAAVRPGGSECAWTAASLAELEATAPVPGFGSSDCRRCPAHLVRLPEMAEPAAALAALGGATVVAHIARES